MNNQGQPEHGGLTLVLRRRPVRVGAGWPEDGHTDKLEVICCNCGDDPDLGYREVTPEVQRIRWSYPTAAGITIHPRHIPRNPGPGR